MSATDLVARSRRNPILTSDGVPYPVATIHNDAATRLDDGRTVLVFRSHLVTARGRRATPNVVIRRLSRRTTIGYPRIRIVHGVLVIASTADSAPHYS